MKTVYVASNQGTDQVYHLEKGCRALKAKHREWDKEDAEKMNYRICKYCDGGNETHFERDKSLRQRINDGEIQI